MKKRAHALDGKLVIAGHLTSWQSRFWIDWLLPPAQKAIP